MPAPSPSPVLQAFLSAYPPAIRDLTLRTRSLLHSLRPGLTENVWAGWKAIGLGTGPKMSDMVIGLGPAKAHLGLHFTQGTLLDDPDGLLQGTSRTARHIKVTRAEDLERPAVRALIDGAFRLAMERTAPAAAVPARDGWERPMSDEAVAAKTGRTWDEWIAELDREGCATMTHREIVAVVRDRFGIGPWWQQSITVGYERARGLRRLHETPQGYQVGGSKTIDAPLDALWKAWNDARTRRRWLPDGFTVRKATAPKSMRVTWHDGSDLQVLFYAKGEAKSQVTVDQRKLPPAQVEPMKAYWKERLGTLKALLEKR